MAKVYSARHSPGRAVAINVLSADAAFDPERLARNERFIVLKGANTMNTSAPFTLVLNPQPGR
jgi:hypothetical protein